ncbi:MAG: hypothetical protein V4696_10945 [Pseudomonadota bacterium]
MTDITFSADSPLISKMFESISYPWRKRIDGDRMSVGEPEIDVTVEGPTSGEDLSANEPDYLKDWVEEYLDASEDARREGEGEKALDELLKPHAVGSTNADEVIEKLLSAPDSEQQVQRFLGALGLKFSVDWIEIELSRKPTAVLGNPMKLGNINIAARVKAKACIKILGKEKCISITSPWVRFVIGGTQIAIQTNGLKVFALASVSDFDLVLKFKILKWSFSVRVGLTKYVNRYLAASRPEIADFGAISIVIPGLDRRYAPTSVTVPNHPSETSVLLEGDFKPS